MQEYMKAQAWIESYVSRLEPNTQRGYRVTWRQWCRWCDERDAGLWWGHTVLAVDRAIAIEFYNALKLQPGMPSRDGRSNTLAPHTVELRLGQLRRIYDWLADSDIYKGAKNPFKFPRQRVPATATRMPNLALSEDESARCLSVFPGLDYRSVMDTAILSLLFGLALRRSEIPSLRVADILPSRKLVIAEQKNKDRSVLVMPDWVWLALQRFVHVRGGQPHDLLFEKREGPYSRTHEGISSSYVRKLFKRALKLAGLSPQYSCHSARRSAITQCYDLGLTTREIQGYARHAKGVTTERYDKRREHQLEKVAATLRYRKVS